MNSLSIQNKYELKELELNALLEVTQAINNNLPESALYKIYNFTLRANLSIRKLALYVLDEDWECKVNFGTDTDFTQYPLNPSFLSIRKPELIDPELPCFNEFDQIIPVAHKANLLAIAFIGGLNPEHAEELSKNGINFIQALSNIIIVAIENKKLARKQLEQEAFRRELEIAHHVQNNLVPKNLPSQGALQVYADYQPHDKVGGDYYDFISLSDSRYMVCVADVSGKGIPAALLMSNFQASLRTLVRKTNDLREIVSVLNSQVFESTKGDSFITFFIAFFDRELEILNYVNSGHNPPLLLHGDQMHMLKDGTTLLGVFEDLPFINEGMMAGLDEFLLFLYTDGLTEVFNEEEEEYGSDRLADFLSREHQKRDNLSALHESLLAELDEYRQGRDYGDDITIVSCRYQPEGQS